MANRLQQKIADCGRFLRFIIRVLRSFKRNQGILLSGAVAYYTLLSIAPMLIIALIVLSHFIDERQLLLLLSTYIEMVIPGYTATLTEQAGNFLEHRHVIGIIGFIVMLFFSSLAFTVLENAMSVIFFHRVQTRHRHLIISMIIPYAYIFLITLGILLLSLVTGVLKLFLRSPLILGGWMMSLEGITGIILYFLGMIGELVMLTSLYLVMPIGKIALRHALIGGITATILWEITRRLLFWYFSVISFVNLIYGSLATAVIFLAMIEAAALILLLGAQVIAEFECANEEQAPDELSSFQT